MILGTPKRVSNGQSDTGKLVKYKNFNPTINVSDMIICSKFPPAFWRNPKTYPKNSHNWAHHQGHLVPFSSPKNHRVLEDPWVEVSPKRTSDCSRVALSSSSPAPASVFMSSPKCWSRRTKTDPEEPQRGGRSKGRNGPAKNGEGKALRVHCSKKNYDPFRHKKAKTIGGCATKFGRYLCFEMGSFSNFQGDCFFKKWALYIQIPHEVRCFRYVLGFQVPSQEVWLDV